MLAIEQHPVEAGGADHFDDLRRGDHHRDPIDRLAGGELFLHAIFFHRCLLKNRTTSSMFAAGRSPIPPERSKNACVAAVIVGSIPSSRNTALTCFTS